MATRRSLCRHIAHIGLMVLLAALTLVVTPPSARADVGAPSWWDGDCDANHWNPAAAAQGWTGAGAHRLGASYLGVPVCGPRRSVDGAPDVQWSRPGWGHLEWECVELAMRFMGQVYGVKAYGANGNTVVSNYTTAYGGSLQRINNGTPGVGPLPGDVISFDNPSSTGTHFGHAAVVASTTVDGRGNGTIKLMSQNDTVDGWRTLTVTNWTVGSFGAYVPYGWLHDPAGRGGGWNSLTLPLGDGPAVVSSAPGQEDVFVRGTDDALWTQHFDGAWSGWTSLGGVLTAAPAAASSQTNVIDLFVKGSDNALWTRRLTNGVWSPWASLGGILTSPPAAVSSQPGVVDLFVRGTDNGVWTARGTNGAWTGWSPLGGVIMSATGVASATPGAIDLFARGTDDAVWTRHSSNGVWTDWTSLGGVVTSPPTAGSASSGAVDLFVRGTDNAVWTRHITNSGATGWSSMGWYVSSPVAAASPGSGTLDLFARGSDNALWVLRVTNGTQGSLTTMGGSIR
jgi:hypothetical protein